MYKLSDGREYIIREVEVEDAQKVLDFMNRAGGESDFLSFGSGELKMTVEDEINYINNCKKSINSVFLMAETDNEVIGTGGIMGNTRAKTVHVADFGLSVSKKYWRNGIGENILDTLIQWAEENEILTKLNLSVYESNEGAIKLYEKLGFVYEGRRVDNYCVRGEYFDSILMGKKV